MARTVKQMPDIHVYVDGKRNNVAVDAHSLYEQLTRSMQGGAQNHNQAFGQLTRIPRSAAERYAWEARDKATPEAYNPETGYRVQTAPVKGHEGNKPEMVPTAAHR